MKTSYIIRIGFICFCFLVLACKSDFEKVRESGNAEQIFAKANEYFDSEEYLKANTLFELVLNQYRGRKEAEDLFFRYAYTHYHLRRYVSAAYWFENFSKTFANSDRREETEFMIGYSYYRLTPSFRLDQKYTKEAITAFQKFVNYFPQSSRVSECNTLIDEMRRKLEKKAFDSAQLYYNIGNYKAALHSFENLLKDYPETPDTEMIRYLIVKASYDLAANSVYEKKKDRYMDVVKYFEEFDKRFPNSDKLKELRILRDRSQKEIKTLNDV
jgi:outer membrane protein assembly factor BamD